MTLRDPSGRLADLARHVLAELDAIEADRAAMEGDPEQPSYGWNVTRRSSADLRRGAEQIAANLAGYTEMPEAKQQRGAMPA